MNGGSRRQRTQHRRTYRGCLLCLVSVMILLSSVARLNSPDSTWAAVYQCREEAGKTVLTNRPLQLNNCRVLTEDPASDSASSAAMATPQDSGPAMNSDVPSAPPYVPPTPLSRQGDPQASAIGSAPAPNPGVSVPPPSPQPCSHGWNPLNPLSAPPCTQSGQSGTNSPGTALTPSQ